VRAGNAVAFGKALDAKKAVACWETIGARVKAGISVKMARSDIV
tara:strand:- start:851 stop:982 length:132 start_codon:yes stop_codon:yes gene_type:complete